MGSRTHLLLTVVIWPLPTHPFRDGAPLLLLPETPPTVGLSIRFSLYYVRRYCLRALIPFLVFPFAATVLSPRIAIVFSLSSRAPKQSGGGGGKAALSTGGQRTASAQKAGWAPQGAPYPQPGNYGCCLGYPEIRKSPPGDEPKKKCSQPV